jgi:hypothetical protein
MSRSAESMEYETTPDGERTGLVSGPGSVPREYRDYWAKIRREGEESRRERS